MEALPILSFPDARIDTLLWKGSGLTYILAQRKATVPKAERPSFLPTKNHQPAENLAWASRYSLVSCTSHIEARTQALHLRQVSAVHQPPWPQSDARGWEGPNIHVTMRSSFSHHNKQMRWGGPSNSSFKRRLNHKSSHWDFPDRGADCLLVRNMVEQLFNCWQLESGHGNQQMLQASFPVPLKSGFTRGTPGRTGEWMWKTQRSHVTFLKPMKRRLTCPSHEDSLLSLAGHKLGKDPCGRWHFPRQSGAPEFYFDRLEGVDL